MRALAIVLHTLVALATLSSTACGPTAPPQSSAATLATIEVVRPALTVEDPRGAHPVAQRERLAVGATVKADERATISADMLKSGGFGFLGVVLILYLLLNWLLSPTLLRVVQLLLAAFAIEAVRQLRGEGGPGASIESAAQ